MSRENELLTKARTSLPFDFASSQSHEYQAYWDVLIRELSSEESSRRHLALKTLSVASPVLLKAALNVSLQSRLVQTLCDTVAGDEVPLHRYSAAQLLGKCVRFFQSEHFPQHLAQHAFKIVYQLMLSAFPHNLTEAFEADPELFHHSRYTPPAVHNLRIQTLYAMGGFLSTSQATDPMFMNYFDKLLAILLNVDTEQFYIHAAVHVIRKYLPNTKRNRIRVDRFFRPLIDTISTAFAVSITSDPSSTKNTRAKADNDRPEPSKALIDELHSFYSVWYPKVADANIVQIKPTLENINRLGDGYAWRRWQQLFQRTVGEGKENQAPVTAKEKEKLMAQVSTSGKNMVLYKAHKDPYKVLQRPAAPEIAFFPESPVFYKQPDSDVILFTPPQVTDSTATIDVPEPSSLTFNLGKQCLIFNRLPFTREIFLQNKQLTADVPFRIQAHPPEHFEVQPSFGVLARGESIKVCITFIPKPYEFRRKEEVHGFIRVRNADGFALERVSLVGITPPYFKVSLKSLDFGFCPQGQTRTATFQVENLTNSEQSLSLITLGQSNYSNNPSRSPSLNASRGGNSDFTVPSNELVLQSRECKLIKVKFKPHSVGPYSDILVLLSTGGDVERIQLTGHGGSSLKVLETKLDFGPTEIDYDAVHKRIVVKNMMPTALPVLFETSTDELIVNEGNPLMLQALEERKLTVAFKSNITGSRSETIIVTAPNADPHTIEVTSFSGPAISVPVADPVAFPVSIVGQCVSVLLPLFNNTDSPVQVLVSVPPKTPFVLRGTEVDFSTPKATSGGIEFRSFESRDSLGALVTLAPKSVATIDALFMSGTPGCFRTVLTVHQVKPRKAPVTSLVLNAVALEEGEDNILVYDESRGSILRDFLAKLGNVKAANAASLNTPGVNLVGSFIGQKSSERSNPHLKTSAVLDIEPKVAAIHGRFTTGLSVVGSTNMSGQQEAIVLLSNNTSREQPYSLLLSHPFMTDVPWVGTLPPQSVLEIPVYFNPSYLTRNSKDIRRLTVLGCLCVIDSSGTLPPDLTAPLPKRGFLSIPLLGILGETLDMDIREEVDSIRFPTVEVNQSVMRKLVIRNKLPSEVPMEIKAVNIGGQDDATPTVKVVIAMASSSQSSMLPFQLSVSKVNLKPFEHLHLEISFSPQKTGDHRVRAFLEYTDSTIHRVNGELIKGGKVKRTLKQMDFVGTAGRTLFSFEPDFISLGHISLGSAFSNSLKLQTISNDEQLMTDQSGRIFDTTAVSVLTTGPVSVPNSFMHLEAKANQTLSISTMPLNIGSFSEWIALIAAGSNRTSLCQVVGTCGDSNLEIVNFPGAIPFKASRKEEIEAFIAQEPSTRHLLRLGWTSSEEPRRISLILRNTGTTDCIISRIATKDPQTLSLTISEVIEPLNGELTWTAIDELDVDLDEAEHISKDANRPQARLQQTHFGTLQRTGGNIVNRPGMNRRIRARTVGTNEQGPKGFPIRLEPFQALSLLLMCHNTQKGMHKNALLLEVEKSDRQTDTYLLKTEFIVETPLRLYDRKIEFGVRPTHTRQKHELRFMNPGSRTLSWRLLLPYYTYLPLSRGSSIEFQETKKQARENWVTCPLEIYPSEGKLGPGAAQAVDIIFKPSLAQYEFLGSIVLFTEDFSQIPIPVHGVGASCSVVSEVESVDMGTMRVGSSKTSRFKLLNTGTLQARYFIESSTSLYTADPEEGVIEGGGSVEIVVKCLPKSKGTHTASLTVWPHSQHQASSPHQSPTSSATTGSFQPVTVNLKAIASYPELVVHTKLVDFGVALLRTLNKRPILVENKGAADAIVEFHCPHPNITLEGSTQSLTRETADTNIRGVNALSHQSHGGGKGEIIVPPLTRAELMVCYIPTILENLDVRLTMRSNDSRGDLFTVSLKGSVGVPRLISDPPNLLEYLDFGVCRVLGIYKQTFKIINDGNIDLKWRMEFSLPKKFRNRKTGDAPQSLNAVAGTEQNISQPIFSVEPSQGHLQIMESVEVTVTFRPYDMQEYSYATCIDYGFGAINGKCVGHGGKAILRLDLPIKTLDFGICRLKRKYVKGIALTNEGNLAAQYHVRPEPENRDWTIYDDELDSFQATRFTDGKFRKPLLRWWAADLVKQGFRILNPDGHVPPSGKMELLIEYNPPNDLRTQRRLRIYYGDGYEDVDIRGAASIPRISLVEAGETGHKGPTDSNNAGLTAEKPSNDSKSVKPFESSVARVLWQDDKSLIDRLDLGVHAINREYIKLLKLMNDSPFSLDFFIQPTGLQEFDISPSRSCIQPFGSVLVKLSFIPSAETSLSTTLKILWEGTPISLNVVGSGGVGRFSAVFMEEKDALLKGLDFGMIPFDTTVERRFALINTGSVAVQLELTLDSDEFTVGQVGESFPLVASNGSTVKTVGNTNIAKDIVSGVFQRRRPVWRWWDHTTSSARLVLHSHSGMELSARFTSRSANISQSVLQVVSDMGTLLIPMRGRGGTMSLSHKGDLSFGDIASNYTYTRKLTLYNSGSISTLVHFEWLVVGHSTEPSPFVKLDETYSIMDPRSGWARQSYFKEKNHVEATNLTARDYWNILRKMVLKSEGDESGIMFRNSTSFMRSSGSGATTGLTRSASGFGNLPLDNSTGMSRSVSVVGKKGPNLMHNAHIKRRNTFFNLIATVPLSSQSVAVTRPFLKVEPKSLMLNAYSETEITIDVNLGSEETFLATLLCRPQISNVPAYEIALTATPKLVNILCDDTRMLNFYRQPLGESESLYRSFTNVGRREFSWQIINKNPGLHISPSRGVLKVGQKVTVEFVFIPMDESIQNATVIFEPDCSQPIKMKMYGGGGFAKCSLSKYRRFDFGHCMINKDTLSYLPITNEGNAFLHLNQFDLIEMNTFFRGENWPTDRISLAPGESYDLPLIFNPKDENPPTGKLIVGTRTETWAIELVGLGREAVLIVNKPTMEFRECLIGNVYEQRLTLKNIGDVNYPVSFEKDPENPDLEFFPKTMVVNPFSEAHVIISYAPTTQVKQTVNMIIASPYSTHKVPISLHSGTASLEFSANVLQFGLFERTSKPSIQFTVRNTGTCRTNFSIRDSKKPSMFSITGAKGMLPAGKSASVTISYIKYQVCSFTEKLTVKTDLVDRTYELIVKGQCEEAIVKPDEFNLVNMGICPVLESTTKQTTITNYGKYPLTFELKFAYPIKVAPVSGVVAGGDSQPISFSWNPSGGYELRSTVQLVTNIGSFNMAVRGKATFPELSLGSTYIDFGVCAIGHVYREGVSLNNRGKVPLTWTIAGLKDNYSVTRSTGSLNPRETDTVEVLFKPTGIGKFASSMSLECKGASYKEVLLVGIGGTFKLDYSPTELRLGDKCPCDLEIYREFYVVNTGDVVAHVSWSESQDDSLKDREICQIRIPEPRILKPGQQGRFVVGITARNVGHFVRKLILNTKEKTFTIPMYGSGLRIKLSEKARQLLSTERLTSIQTVQPLRPYKEKTDLERAFLKLSKQRQTDLQIAMTTANLYNTLFLSLAKKPPSPSKPSSPSKPNSAGSTRKSRPSSIANSSDTSTSHEKIQQPEPMLPTSDSVEPEQADGADEQPEKSAKQNDETEDAIVYDEDLREGIVQKLTKLQTDGVKSADDIDWVVNTYMNFRIDLHNRYRSAEFSSPDFVAESVVRYPYVDMEETPLDLICALIEPEGDDPIVEYVCARPLEFREGDTETTTAKTTQGKRKLGAYTEKFIPFNRKKRNALATDFWTVQGQGIYKSAPGVHIYNDREQLGERPYPGTT